jgi:hypothetical protein
MLEMKGSFYRKKITAGICSVVLACLPRLALWSHMITHPPAMEFSGNG